MSEVKIKIKICSKCGVEKDVSAFSKDSQKKDGLRPSCKLCGCKQQNPEFFKENKIKKDLFAQGFKKCSKCNKIKHLDLFYKNKGRSDGYLNICIDCKCPNSPEIENGRLFKDGKRRCNTCHEILRLDQFHKSSKTKIGRTCTCVKCRQAKAARPHAVKKRVNRQLLFDQGLKKCSKCGRIKTLAHFGLSSNSKWKVVPYCRDCMPSDPIVSAKYYSEHKEELCKRVNEKNRLPSKSKKLFNQLPITDNPMFDDQGYITVRCYFCHKQFKPIKSSIQNRIGAIKGYKRGSYNMYCSDECKNNCFSYHFNPLRVDPRSKLYIPKTEIQSARAATKTAAIKKAVCDKYGELRCEICGQVGEVELHHTLPVAQFGMESVDPDSFLMLCHTCHVKLHGECR